MNKYKFFRESFIPKKKKIATGGKSGIIINFFCSYIAGIVKERMERMREPISAASLQNAKRLRTEGLSVPIIANVLIVNESTLRQALKKVHKFIEP